MNFYIYILQCKDGYFYTGITANLKKRLNEHQLGFSRLTKNRRPTRVVYREQFSTREKAARRKKEIKGWKREKKENLIKVYSERTE